jgi:hypothetical protein
LPTPSGVYARGGRCVPGGGSPRIGEDGPQGSNGGPFIRVQVLLDEDREGRCALWGERNARFGDEGPERLTNFEAPGAPQLGGGEKLFGSATK